MDERSDDTLTAASLALARQKAQLSATEFAEIDRPFRARNRQSLSKFLDAAPSSRPIINHLAVTIEVLNTRIPKNVSFVDSVKFLPEIDLLLRSIKLYSESVYDFAVKNPSRLRYCEEIMNALSFSEAIVTRYHNKIAETKNKNEIISENVISLEKYIKDRRQLDAPISAEFNNGRLIYVDLNEANTNLSPASIKNTKEAICEGIEAYISKLKASNNIDPRIIDIFSDLLSNVEKISRERVIAAGLNANLASKVLHAARDELSDILFVYGQEVSSNVLHFCMQFQDWNQFQANASSVSEMERVEIETLTDGAIKALDAQKSNVDPYIIRTLSNIKSYLRSKDSQLKMFSFAALQSIKNIFVVLGKYTFETVKRFGSAILDGTIDAAKKAAFVVATAIILTTLGHISGISPLSQQMSWLRAIGDAIAKLTKIGT